MGGIGSLLGNIIGSVLPFARGGIVKGKEKEYIVKVKDHVRKLPKVDTDDVDKKRDKYKIKVARRDKKKEDADLLRRQNEERKRNRQRKKIALNREIREYPLKKRARDERKKFNE